MRCDVPSEMHYRAEADETPFEFEFIDNREIGCGWYCTIKFGGKYIAGDSDDVKEQAFAYAIHYALVWLHDIQVSFDETWQDVIEQEGF